MILILLGLAGMCIYEGRIEEVRFDRNNNSMMLKRMDSACNSKWTVKVSCHITNKLANPVIFVQKLCEID